jgi:hypothetical protein
MVDDNTSQDFPVHGLRCWQDIDGEQVEIDCPEGTLASSEKATQRMDVCKACSSYKSLLFMCGECNCIMPAKTRINSAECPLGKW